MCVYTMCSKVELKHNVMKDECTGVSKDLGLINRDNLLTFHVSLILIKHSNAKP